MAGTSLRWPRIVVTSVVRHAELGASSGWIRVLDAPDGRCLLSTPIPEAAGRAREDNPRGGARGARGIAVHGERLVVANHERLFVLDRRWELVRSITHPWMGAVHDVLADAEGIWVTCTNCDVLLRTSWEGVPLHHWTWRDDPQLIKALGFRNVPAFDVQRDYRDPVTMRQGVFNMVHLNAVTNAAGGTIVSFGRILAPARYRWRRAKGAGASAARLLGVTLAGRTARHQFEAGPAVPVDDLPNSAAALILLEPGGGNSSADAPGAGASLAGAHGRVLVHQAPVHVPNHNVLELGDVLLYNDSNAGRVVVYDPRAQRQVAAIDIPGAPSFARGMALSDDGLVLVGSQAPAAVYAVDVTARRVVGSLELEGQPTESVYAVCVLPSSFGDPPGQPFDAVA